mgnify:CR=1 FL=1
MSIELKKANEYEKAEQEKIPVEEKPAFHVAAPVGWINDPNGFSWYQGQIHLFYQYHPYTTEWGPMHWGHSVSDDMIHWKNMPSVLAPDQEYDKRGCFSGSAVEKDGKHVLIYTGVSNVQMENGSIQERQNQCIAYGDGEIYVKSPQNPVITGDMLPADCSKIDFRDPKVWKKGENYYLIVGNKNSEQKGQVVLFSSKNLEKWKFETVLAENSTGQIGTMWECPDLFCLDGQLCLVCCPQGVKPMGTEYQNVHQCTVFCLDYDFRENTCKLKSQLPGMVDRGFDFYAPQTFLDEKGRRILIGWMGIPDADYTNPTVNAGWQHALTMPRQLHMREGRLLQQPLEEMRELRRDRRDYDFEELAKGVEPGLVFEGRISFVTCHDMCLTVRGDVTLSYENGLLTLDMGTCGSGRTRRSVPLERLTDLHIFSDTTSLEIFVNEGREVFTTRVYGSHPGMRMEGDCSGNGIVYGLNGFIYE